MTLEELPDWLSGLTSGEGAAAADAGFKPPLGGLVKPAARAKTNALQDPVHRAAERLAERLITQFGTTSDVRRPRRPALRESDVAPAGPPDSGSCFSFRAPFAAAASAASVDPKLDATLRHARAEEFVSRSIALLTRGYETGEFKSKIEIHMLQTEPEFEILRSRPDFLSLLQKIETDHKK